MVFNSLQFLLLFPVILLLYFTLPKKAGWIMLLAFSYYFYMSWNARLIFLILFTTTVAYCGAILIENNRKKKNTDQNGLGERFLLIVSLTACLGILFFYKYFNFFSASISGVMGLFGVQTEPFVLNLILPVGISFYTFQTLSYVIDVYRGDIRAERHFGYFALYVSYFPQLVAGPIERPENLIPQLHEKHAPCWENTVAGLRKMLVGFFKKVVVADLIGVYVNAVYNDAENASGLGVLIATVFFAFQIYCDFSGYTDIAIGCSKIMGINLMQNFDRPYSAQSIKEFWRRWHISLSSWFKDYVYFPLGGSRCAVWRHMLNICIVFLVSGLWHGAAWNFVIWGGLHGVYQVIGYFTQKPRDRMWRYLGVDPKSKGVCLLRRFVTFVLVCFAWIFFRANSMSDLSLLLAKLFGDWRVDAAYFTDTLSQMELDALGIVTTVLSIVVMALFDRNSLASTRQNIQTRYVYTVWVIALAWILLLLGDGASSFIYFQF